MAWPVQRWVFGLRAHSTPVNMRHMRTRGGLLIAGLQAHRTNSAQSHVTCGESGRHNHHPPARARQQSTQNTIHNPLTEGDAYE